MLCYVMLKFLCYRKYTVRDIWQSLITIKQGIAEQLEKFKNARNNNNDTIQYSTDLDVQFVHVLL